ncbi:MAG: 2Fe-2S iron-sulfur cluster binding domain-containing protein [Hyphomonas sp.]|nr:2Fe-2S iron-sulfur cluster binding domain-containing protein [Hyphomonas sp.]MBU4061814.1 2Fe-2S iron-sulfur cluster binding domain-containing protein [Alphaproteobacteria bacterium]MBU4163354.1 2Fe-2S iron-sulfur cluster binding domain-containing protein [Alphaproteobacteria bacterium]
MTAFQLFGYIAAALALQILLAGAIAVLRRRPKIRQLLTDTASQKTPQGAWVGWRDFRVVARTYEDPAETQCSFTLAPVDGAPLPPFIPGQFLTVRLAMDGQGEPARVVRCYSISDTPDPGRYRITVKRAIAPPGKPDLPAGVASSWLHDHAQVGTILQFRAPSGQFVFSPDANASPVFIAGGIGITPILSMLKAALADQPGRAAHLYYGVRGGQDHAFKAVLSELAQTHPGLDLHVFYAEPATGDVQGRDYDHAGFISLDMLKQTLPHGRHAFYICGPDQMTKALIPALLAWGVQEGDIHREAFGPQSAALKPPAVTASGPVLTVGFRRSGRTLEWAGQDANLLDFAERQSIPVDSGCRSGSCGTCETRLISGRVRYETKPDHDIAPGHCLVCVGIPETALELDA